MAKDEQRDISEYYVLTEPIDLSSSLNETLLPIPQAGYILRIQAVVVVKLVTGGATMLFLLGGKTIFKNGAPVSLGFGTSSDVGDVKTLEFDRTSEAYAKEAEDGENGLVSGIESVLLLEVDSSTASAGAIQIMVTIGR